MKMNVTELPAQPAEMHFAISQTAAVILGGWVDGNGLKAEQVRLVRHDTQVHKVPGAVMAGLEPEISKSELKGRNPRGLVLGTQAEVHAHAEGMIEDFLNGHDIQVEIMQAVDRTPEKGFGMDPTVIPLGATKKEFSTIDMCLKCSGQTFLSCVPCSATGSMPCNFCNGQGFTPCETCFGMGRIQQSNGSQAPCQRCQSTGRIHCTTCQGQRNVSCQICAGSGRTGCLSCGQSGFLTSVYQAGYKAVIDFDLDRRQIPVDVQKIIDEIGVKKLSIEEHAEIFRHPLEVRESRIFIPFTALFPVAAAEFSAEGKIYPATVAGLQGRITQIDPVLDALVKPGINALIKISKGPMASQALIDTACKYRMIRQVISGLAHRPKRIIYQKLVRDYPVVLSKKYANATVQYAGKALLSISAGPRLRGLLAGTVLTAGLAAGYYMTGFRSTVLAQMQQKGIGQHIVLADIAIWVLGYALTVFVIRFSAAAALKKLLPGSVQTAEKGMPPAGAQGLWALLTTAAACFAIAAFSAVKPEWMVSIFRALGIIH